MVVNAAIMQLPLLTSAGIGETIAMEGGLPPNLPAVDAFSLGLGRSLPPAPMIVPSVIKYSVPPPVSDLATDSAIAVNPSSATSRTKPPVIPFSQMTEADRAGFSPEVRAVLDHLPVLNRSRYPELDGLEGQMTALTAKIVKPEDGCDPIYVAILDDARPNSFVMRFKNSGPRVIGINLGYIRRFQNDDQAAAIIGHEIEHLSSQIYPHVEELMKEANGDFEKLFLLQMRKAEEIEVDLKSIFWRVHKMGFNPTLLLDLMNELIKDIGDRLGRSHPLWKTRRNAVELALTGMRRILGEKISESPPQHNFVLPQTSQFLRSPAFVASRREDFSVRPELHDELMEFLQRIESDSLTEKDIYVEDYENHPIFDKIVESLLVQNMREVGAFYDETQNIGLQNRALRHACDYFESHTHRILGRDFEPRSARQFSAFDALSRRSLSTPSWDGQFFTAGSLMMEIGKHTFLLRKLEREIIANPSPSVEDLDEYEGRRAKLVRKIEKLSTRQKAHLTAFDDVPEVRMAMKFYLRYGLSGRSGAGARIPEEISKSANNTLWRHLKYIGPIMSEARERQLRIRDKAVISIIRWAEDISDLHGLMRNHHISSESGEEVRRLFCNRYFDLAEKTLSAGEVSPELWESIRRFFKPLSSDANLATPLDVLKRNDAKGFLLKAQSVFEKLAGKISTSSQFRSLMEDMDEWVKVSPDSLPCRDRVFKLAFERVAECAVESAREVSVHTDTESMGHIIKPGYGDAGVYQSFDGTMTSVIIKIDDWDRLPDHLEIYSVGGMEQTLLGTAGELRLKDAKPYIGGYGYLAWATKFPSSADDLRSYLPYLDALGQHIERHYDDDSLRSFRDAFGIVSRGIYEVLSKKTWFCLSRQEWNTVMSLRYGHLVLTSTDQALPASCAKSLLQKLKGHQGFREVIDFYRLMDWMERGRVPEGERFEQAFRCGDILKTGHISFYSSDPRGECDRRENQTARFFRWMSRSKIEAGFQGISPFLSLLHIRIEHPLKKERAYIDDEACHRHLLPLLKAVFTSVEERVGYEEACRQMIDCLVSAEIAMLTYSNNVLLDVVDGREPDQMAFALKEFLRVYREKHKTSRFSNTTERNLVSEMFEELLSMSVSSCYRADLIGEALLYDSTDSLGDLRGEVFDAYFELCWQRRDDPRVQSILKDPRLVGALQYHSNKKKLAQWQLNVKFDLDRTEKDILSGVVPTPHHTMVRPVIHEVKRLIDEQFPKNSALKDAVIDYAEDKMVSTPAENDALKSSRLDVNNWYKAAELSLADLPAIIDYSISCNFDRLELISYFVGRRAELPRFVSRRRFDRIIDAPKRAFTEASLYARAAFLHSFLDENDGIFSDRKSIEELERLVLGDYVDEPVFRAIYKAYLTAAPREQVRVLIASLLSTFVDAPPGTKGASLKEILNSMGPFGWKTGQFMRSSGIVGRKLSEELDSLYDRAAPPSRRKVVEDLRLVFGEDLAHVHGIRELKGSGSINYVVAADLIAPDGTLQRVAVLIKRDNVEGLVYNENLIWEKAIAELKSDPDIDVRRKARIVDEARRHSMATMRTGGDELSVSAGVAKYESASAAYGTMKGQYSGRAISVGKPVQWALDLAPPDLRDKFAFYEHVDFVPLLEIPQDERDLIIRDIIKAELTAMKKQRAFDPDGHRGNWLVSRDGKSLVRVDYAQLRHTTEGDVSDFFGVFNQLAFTAGSFSGGQIDGMAIMLSRLVDSFPGGIPARSILANALNSSEMPDASKPHERLLYLRDRLGDYIQGHGDPTFLLQFADNARSMLAGIAKISGYRAYTDDGTFMMAMAEGLMQ